MQLALLSFIMVANLHRCSLSWKQQHIFLLFVWSCPETLDLKDLSQYGGRSKQCRCLQSSDPTWNSNFLLACVASISVWFRSKTRPRNRIFCFGPMRIETRAKKWKRGKGKEGNPTSPFFSNPSPLFYSCHFSHSLFFTPKLNGNARYAG